MSEPLAPIAVGATYRSIQPQHNFFKMDSKYYYIKSVPERSSHLDKITYPLSGDEIIAEHGVYVYVILRINEQNIVYAKPTLSIQEIQTKHMELISDIKDKLEVPFETGPDGSPILYLLYAGEMKVEITDEITVNFNFLSGTYMSERIDPNEPKGNDEIAIQIFRDNISVGVKYQYLKGTLSLITNKNIPPSHELIAELIHSGAVIYVVVNTEGLNENPTEQYRELNRMIIDKFTYYPPRLLQIERQCDTLIDMAMRQPIKGSSEEDKTQKIKERDEKIIKYIEKKENDILKLNESLQFDKYFKIIEPSSSEEIPPNIQTQDELHESLKSIGKGGRRRQKTRNRNKFGRRQKTRNRKSFYYN